MAKVSTSISIDADVKAQAQALFADFGLDLSTAINILHPVFHSARGSQCGHHRRYAGS